jgi:hypothetical protein
MRSPELGWQKWQQQELVVLLTFYNDVIETSIPVRAVLLRKV